MTVQCSTVSTGESLVFEPPRETKIGLKNWVGQEIRDKIHVQLRGGKQFLVQAMERLKKSFEIGILLYV